ncbi:MAG: ABC transporter ATP-binding protein [Erysipelotrichaceae bacterium]|nr:ABC transporter ATP-binding protein [Erysipelotrichaceae bacterium]
MIEHRNNVLIEFKNIVKSYTMGDITINASNGVNFEVNRGEFVVIVGASGAGKTTILNLLGGMDSPTSGSIIVDGENIARYDEKKLTEYRRDDIGFVFQFYNLVQNLTALENVEIATQICRNPLDAQNVLDRVGLSDRMSNFPAQLSGGEQQRVAIARAIAKNPKLLLCDEPTGALDYKTGKSILALLREMCDTYQMTVIVITHNSALAPMADRVIHLRSGKVYQMDFNENPTPIEEIEW